MKSTKKLGLDKILSLIKSGLNPSQISKENKIPKQTLDYTLGKLKKMGCIEKIGYGVWKFVKEVPIQPKDTKTAQIGTYKKQIRGHAFIWVIEFMNYNYDWLEIVREYKKRYKRPKLTFKFLANGKVPRTIFNNRKIWLTKRGMTIYEPIDFLGRSSFETKGTAVYEMDQLVKGLLKALNQKFRTYRFTCSREHYAYVKNSLAKQYNDRKQKMAVRNEEGTIWLWIDDSPIQGYHPGELETDDPTLSRATQNFWNNNILKHKGKVNADFVLNGFNKLTAAQVEGATQLTAYKEQNKEHLALIQEYREESRQNKALIIELIKQLKK